ncbi:MAG: trigger factor [Anaerolineales bacterium]
MKVETQSLENRQVEMTVEVPDEQLQRALRTAARRISREIKIPGFRPGKAPYNLIAQKIGEDALLDEALDDIGQELYAKALEEVELEPFAPGTLNEIVSRQPLILRYTVPLTPEVDLGDYRNVRIEHEEPDVDDEAVESVMEELRQGQALIEPVERAAQMGDVIVVDVDGELIDDNEAEDSTLIEEKNASLLLEEETDWPFPGISDELVGMEAGQETSVEHTFPDDYRNESLQGKQARFDFTCLEVKSRMVPEWTDDLARNVGDFDDLLALRIKIRENLTEEMESRSKNEYRNSVMDAVIEGAEIDFPPYLLEREVDDMLHDLGHRLERQNLSLQDYLQIEGKTLDELREQFEPDARDRLLRGLVLGHVVEEEGIEVEASEIDEALDKIVEPLGDDSTELRKQLNNAATRRQIELDLMTDKALERLLAIARGEAESEQPQLEEAEQELEAVTVESPPAETDNEE